MKFLRFLQYVSLVLCVVALLGGFMLLLLFPPGLPFWGCFAAFAVSVVSVAVCDELRARIRWCRAGRQ